MERIGVMHLIDTLDRGGAERVAVDFVNHLPRDRYRIVLCTTRREGALAELVAEDVERLRLFRTWRFEWRAVRRLVACIRSSNIQVLHAHGTSLFLAAVATLFPPHPRLIWHDHFGGYAVESRPAWAYRALTSRARAVIVVSRRLRAWARTRLQVSPERVWLIPNGVVEPNREPEPARLPGSDGRRIVCVANLRPQKDQLGLLRAMRFVIEQAPSAQLVLVGAAGDAAYGERVEREIVRLQLTRNVTLLGPRDDVYAVLRACDIGVLSSASEGLPLALLEYGMAGLPAVATSVGDCPEVLDQGRAGLLVSPGNPDRLAAALLSLLGSAADRTTLGERLGARVRAQYSLRSTIRRVCAAYDVVLDQPAAPPAPPAAR